MTMIPARPDPGKIRIEITQYCERTGKYMRTATGTPLPEPNMTAIMQVTGLAYTTLIPLLRNPSRKVALSLDTLARICDALQCQPGDILRYEPHRRGHNAVVPENPAARAMTNSLGLS